MPFPLAKLVALGLRQASRHVANFVKLRAKEHETIRNILIKPARWYHSLQTKSRLSVLGMGKMKKGTKVEPLSQQAALDLGTEILGDLVIIACALGIYILIESRPWKRQDDGLTQEEEMQNLKELVSEQGIEIETQAAKLREMERLLYSTTMYAKTSSRVMEEYASIPDSKKKS